MLVQVSDGVFCDAGPVHPLGLALTATMTVMRLAGGALLVHSPLPLTSERRAQVLALGTVAHLYAPNTFHHSWLGEWVAAFPAALVHAPAELRRKRPQLGIDRAHDEEELHIEGITEVPIRGFRLRETVLIHAADRTAVVADLVHNIGRPHDAWTKLYSKTMGFYDRVALSRMLRWTSFDDRGAARISLDAVLSHRFETLIVGHGAPIQQHARETLAHAMAWLPSKSPRSSAGSAPSSGLCLRPCG
jgi:hypothetical protein